MYFPISTNPSVRVLGLPLPANVSDFSSPYRSRVFTQAISFNQSHSNNPLLRSARGLPLSHWVHPPIFHSGTPGPISFCSLSTRKEQKKKLFTTKLTFNKSNYTRPIIFKDWSLDLEELHRATISIWIRVPIFLFFHAWFQLYYSGSGK